jgi:hypothetical protein
LYSFQWIVKLDACTIVSDKPITGIGDMETYPELSEPGAGGVWGIRRP